VAHLDEAQGDVQRDQAEQEGRWTKASRGARFVQGDGLRTGGAASAQVKLTRGGTLRLGENSFIRFLSKAAEGAAERVQVDVGAAVVKAGPVAIEVKMRHGQMHVDPASTAQVKVGKQQEAHIEVTLGRVRFSHEQGETRSLTPGKHLVNIGPDREPSSSSTAASRPADAAAGDAVDDGGSGTYRVVVSGAKAHMRGKTGDWTTLSVGTSSLERGSSIKLRDDGQAEVFLGETRASLSGGAMATLGGQEGALLTVRRGSARVEAGRRETLVAVPGGTILLKSQARSQVVVPRRGRAAVRSLGGHVEVQGEGEPVLLGPGAVATVATDGKALALVEPDRAHYALDAGRSVVLHEPTPPTAVGVRLLDHCPGEGVVETIADEDQMPLSARSTTMAILRLPAGRHQYQVRCVVNEALADEAAATGEVQVIHDPGTAALGAVSHNTVDADGRSYNVLFQGIPPRMTFTWRDAPRRGPYDLSFRLPGGRRVSRRSETPRLSTAPGVIIGQVVFQFTTPAGQRSPETRLNLRADPSVAFISIRRPRHGRPAPGDTVKVTGLARPGTELRVGSEQIPFPSRTKFAGEVTPSTEFDAIALEATHPQAGEHVFLRRFAKGRP
jgi:hypothetical protein